MRPEFPKNSRASLSRALWEGVEDGGALALMPVTMPSMHSGKPMAKSMFVFADTVGTIVDITRHLGEIARNWAKFLRTGPTLVEIAWARSYAGRGVRCWSPQRVRRCCPDKRTRLMYLKWNTTSSSNQDELRKTSRHASSRDLNRGELVDSFFLAGETSTEPAPSRDGKASTRKRKAHERACPDPPTKSRRLANTTHAPAHLFSLRHPSLCRHLSTFS